jgi:short-subunit dehydrogenase
MNEPVFRENVVIITGASSGIGRELALQLADQGAWLALASRTAGQLEEVSEQCRQRGGRAVSIPTDVAIQAQCQHLVEAAAAEYGRIDTLVNNAGIVQVGRFHKLQDLSVYEKVIQVNFLGSVYCTHYALPHLMKNAGRIVGISSLRGLLPSRNADAYGESKHALAGFYDNLRLDLVGTGVSVTALYPGWVSTGLSSRALRADGTPTGKISKLEKGAMPVDVCVRIIIRAMEKRKREVIMTLPGKLGAWFRHITPGIVDRIAKGKS